LGKIFFLLIFFIVFYFYGLEGIVMIRSFSISRDDIFFLFSHPKSTDGDTPSPNVDPGSPFGDAIFSAQHLFCFYVVCKIFAN
jgi:hypothetical protein